MEYLIIYVYKDGVEQIIDKQRDRTIDNSKLSPAGNSDVSSQLC